MTELITSVAVASLSPIMVLRGWRFGTRRVNDMDRREFLYPCTSCKKNEICSKDHFGIYFESLNFPEPTGDSSERHFFPRNYLTLLKKDWHPDPDRLH